MGDGFSAGVAAAVFEKLDGLFERVDGDIGEARGGGLIRSIVDGVASEFVPVADPEAAEGTVAIEDQKRMIGAGGHDSRIITGACAGLGGITVCGVRQAMR